MTAPSNANTSGLEVVARVYNTIGGEPKAIMEQHDRFMSGEPLVTAASAQARIDAAKARADRLAKALERIADVLSSEPFDRDAVIPAYKDARAALQQEIQP